MTAYSGWGLLLPSNSPRCFASENVCFASENVCFATFVSPSSYNRTAADALNPLKIEFFPLFHNHAVARAVENLSRQSIF